MTVYDILKQNNRIMKSSELENLLNLAGAHIRRQVNELRTQGYPICSDSRGYWIAQSAEEFDSNMDHLIGRGREVVNTGEAAKRQNRLRMLTNNLRHTSKGFTPEQIRIVDQGLLPFVEAL